MFNMWQRIYVHTFDQRAGFDSKMILADAQYKGIVIAPDNYYDGGEMVHRADNIAQLLTEHYDGEMTNLFARLLNEDGKWAIVVQPADYYFILGCYLKELQHSFGISDDDIQLMAMSFPYDNFYYSSDATFVDGFMEGTFQRLLKSAMDGHTPTGVLSLIPVTSLPTELGYFLLSRGLVEERQLHDKFVNAARLVVERRQQTHDNDMSEWCVQNTRQFLNLLRAPDSPEVLAADFGFSDFAEMIKRDSGLSSHLVNYIALCNPGTNWSSVAAKTTAAHVMEVWERMSLYQQVAELWHAQVGDDRAARQSRRFVDCELDSANIQRNLDWLHSAIETDTNGLSAQYADTIAHHERVKSVCDAVKFLLDLRGAPEQLDAPIISLLGYDILSEAMNEKYNKTMLLMAINTPSSAFVRFATEFFGPQDIE